MSIRTRPVQAVKHGGDLEDAKRLYPQQVCWLDLSTGISPWSWPVPTIADDLWRNLPPSTDALVTVAASEFGVNKNQLAVSPGSQLAIRLIPQLFESSQVAIPSLGYQEHARSWALAGHHVVYYHSAQSLRELIVNSKVDHAVVINPNNPTGETFTHDYLAELSAVLRNTSGGYLLMDEAFADCKTQDRVMDLVANMIVYRSLGKFYGLAGLRVGFVLSNTSIIASLRNLLEPWPISGPSLYIAEQALVDTRWKTHQRARIKQQSLSFATVLKDIAAAYNITTLINSGLFLTLFGGQKQIDQLHRDLAKIGIWTRPYNRADHRFWLRFSLPQNMEKFCKRTLNLNRQYS